MALFNDGLCRTSHLRRVRSTLAYTVPWPIPLWLLLLGYHWSYALIGHNRLSLVMPVIYSYLNHYLSCIVPIYNIPSLCYSVRHYSNLNSVTNSTIMITIFHACFQSMPFLFSVIPFAAIQTLIARRLCCLFKLTSKPKPSVAKREELPH